jgi:TM2 domain-containing membrane protein YozV
VSQNNQINQSAALAEMVSEVGCATGLVAIVIIGVAFGAGRFLDSYLGTNGILTVLFMVGSFPITLFAMVRISLAMVARTQRRMAKLEEAQAAKAQEQKDNI